MSEGLEDFDSFGLTCGLLSLINILGSSESIQIYGPYFTIINFLFYGLIFGGFLLIASGCNSKICSPFASGPIWGAAAINFDFMPLLGFEGLAVVPGGESQNDLNRTCL